MNYLIKFSLNVLVVFFICCIFAAFIEGNIDVATWDEGVKGAVIAITIMVNIFYALFKELM